MKNRILPSRPFTTPMPTVAPPKQSGRSLVDLAQMTLRLARLLLADAQLQFDNEMRRPTGDGVITQKAERLKLAKDRVAEGEALVRDLGGEP